MTTMVARPLIALAAATLAVVAGCGGDDEPPATTVAAAAVTDDTAGVAEPAEPASPLPSSDCPPVDGEGPPVRRFDAPPPRCLDPDAVYEAVVSTNKGGFTIALDPETAPVAADNFVFLARNRYFDDTVCHRIIPDFVVQCGDPTATGTGGPGYTIVDEPPAAGQYRIGSIAMAKTPAPDSAGSQFFIITGADGAALPPEYALFGHVVDGLETTVEAMAAAGTPDGTPSEPIEIRSVRIIQS